MDIFLSYSFKIVNFFDLIKLSRKILLKVYHKIFMHFSEMWLVSILVASVWGQTMLNNTIKEIKIRNCQECIIVYSKGLF